MPILVLIMVLLWSNNIAAAELSMSGILSAPPDQQLGTGIVDFKRALSTRDFFFPQDHLVHQDYRTEWWYFSGNLTSKMNQEKQQAKFGYQFTLFRFALHPERADGSAWRTDNIYMAHIALTDINGGKIYQQERFSRDGLGLAGAQINDEGIIQIWLNDWQAKSLQKNQLFPLQLNIQGELIAFNLHMESSKPLVLQGENGLSQKSAQPGNASYYYSYTRLNSTGTVRIGKNEYSVSGNSWLDREWSTSSLGKEQQGWDWFALHLEDGSELMLYQMRNSQGAKDDYSSGMLVNAKGESQALQANDFNLQALEYWQSPVSDIRYPVKWQVLLPNHKLALNVSAKVKQQEWAKANGFSFNYWEGAVETRGTKNQQPISGSGYLEMTGYK